MNSNVEVKSINIAPEKQVSKEFVARESQTIWNKVKRMQCARVDTEEIADAILKEHRDFFSAYPMIVRMMINFSLYSYKAVVAFLSRLTPWKTEDEFIDAQADFVVILYRHTKKGHMTIADYNNIKTTFRDALRRERDELKANMEKARALADEKERAYDVERRRELRDLFTKQ